MPAIRENGYAQPVGEPVAGWAPRPYPPRTAMQGRFCRVEPIDPARHAEELFEAYHLAPDGRDWTYLPSEELPADLPWFRDQLMKYAASNDPLHFAVIDAGTGKAVGTCAYLRIAPDHGVIEIGHIAWSPLLQRRPASTEAMFLMMRRAFDELGYRRYEWKCDSLNAPSRRAAERYGFTFEGVFRQALVTKGRNRDTAWFSIIGCEWPEIRRAFEAWLAPENFGADGRQRRGLAEIRLAGHG
ncbi:MAG TPA: GNAT family protein [Acetobacteraceae bacterium]|nr:GNAT family protein [Acetobacteraceae bacterium]